MIMTKLFSRVVTTVLILLSSQIAYAGTKNIDKELLKQRIQNRWQAIADKKFDIAYQFESPSYKKVFPKHLYTNKFEYGSDSELKEIRDITYDPETRIATILVTLLTKSSASKGNSWAGNSAVPVKTVEKWLLHEKTWWRVSRD